jgi:hypothetical protein
MSGEQAKVRAQLAKLKRARRHLFPNARARLDVPNEQGVYLIYSPDGEILHVGRTYRGTKGLRQRINNHLHAASSFTNEHLKGRGSKLRRGYKFSYVEIPEGRLRALVEAYATGTFCPVHLGISEKKPGKKSN